MIWSGQTPKHEADHSEAKEGGDGARVAFEVAREAAVAADPGEGALDDPTFREDEEAMEVRALDDFHPPRAGGRNGGLRLRPLITAVTVDQLDEGEQPARALQHGEDGIAILHIGRMDDDAQQQAERVDENMPLAARDLLARIETLRVERGAPF
jgi:hypothetical protein